MAKTDKLSEAELAEQYGFARALFYSDPSLKKLLKDAIKNEYSPDMFQAKLRATPWYKNHTEAERKYLATKYGDPAQAKQDYNDALLKTKIMAEQLGLTYGKSKDQIEKAALNVASKGWTDEQVRSYLGAYIGFDPSKGYHLGGEAGDAVDALHQFAYGMGVKMSDSWLETNVRNIIRGVTSQKDVEQQLKNIAKSQFPSWAKQIDAGQSVMDLASPYLQQMSQTLELPPGSVNLFDPTIKKALTGKDQKTGQPVTTPLWQFEQQLKQDPRWKKTKNAQDSVTSLAHKVLQDFGFNY